MAGDGRSFGQCPAGRRAAILRPGLTLAALLVCPLHLGVGLINGHQADCLGRPPPGSVRRPGERLVLRFGEINHDAQVSFSTVIPKPPCFFVPILALGRHYSADRKRGAFTLYIYHIFLLATSLHE